MKYFFYVFLLCITSIFSFITYANELINQKQQEQANKLTEKNELEQLCAEGNKYACNNYNQLDYDYKNNRLKLDPSFIDKFSNQFTETVEKWLLPIKQAATYLLFTLGTISLVLRMLPLVFKGAEFGEIVKELIVFLLLIGIWYALILNAKEWTDAIIDSFAQLANLSSVSASGTTPLTILQSGFITVSKILTSIWNPTTLLIYTILSLIIIMIFSMIAFSLLKVILETIIISYAGLLMVGFAGLDYTSDYAKRYLTYTIAIGFKYYITLIIAGFGITFVNDIITDVEFGSVGACLGVICIISLLWKITEEIPNMAQSMITGANISNNHINISNMFSHIASAGTAWTAATYAEANSLRTAQSSSAMERSYVNSTMGMRMLEESLRESKNKKK